MTLATYLPQDRLRALAGGESLPDRTTGSALFADISGFTPLTEYLRNSLGPRRGAEELTRHLNTVYTALIATVEKQGGSVIGFAGDAITCWFDEDHGDAARRAVACGLALQVAIRPFHTLLLADNTIATLALKVAIATGTARRFVVGDLSYQYLDTLAGATVARMAAAEHLADKGETLVDEATVQAVGDTLTLHQWRPDPETEARFGVVQQFAGDVAAIELPELPAVDPPLLRSWLHRQVYEREQAGQTSFLTEFRPCVALFVRFVGIDYDTDDAQAQLDAFIRQMQAIAARYDGALLQVTIGDKGSYAYLNFGALSVHEDDARRAVAAALALNEVAQGLVWLEPLQMGITHGVMWVGACGGTTRRAYSALGDAANLAARLMQTAAPGEILVSQQVQTAVAHHYSFKPYPLLQVKGKAKPLVIFAVIGARQWHLIRLQEPTYTLPMVGRQAELQTIKDKLDLARQGQAQVVGIVAEAGLGKSRLVAEVIGAASQKGFVGYGGACQSDGIHTPYLAWQPIWRAFFNVDPTAPPREQIRLLTDEIERLAPERLPALPLLGALLNLAIPDNEFTRSLEPKDRKGALHALLEDCLKAAADVRASGGSSLLIVIEDLHWIDALSHDLLDEMARATVAWPICFMMAYRPPQPAQRQAPRLESLPCFTKIELHELTAVEAEQAIQAKLAQLYPTRDGAAPPWLTEKLMARAQGNPFYLEELLNFLHDRGLDPRNPADLDKIELPDSLHTLILTRIDQLTEREKSTLRVASIVGRLFRAKWLTGYYPKLGDFVQVKADLNQLHALDITPLDSPEPELVYLFKHIVTHEVTYESLPFATRARLHEQLGRYLESIAAPLPTIAHHYGQSENRDKQREYFQKAGDAAQAAFANAAALDYFARLLPLMDDPRAQLELHLQRGAVLEMQGQFSEVEMADRAALATAERIADGSAIARCQLALGKLFRLRGEYAGAQAWLKQACDRFTSLDDCTGLAHTRIEMGIVWQRQGEYANARQELEIGLALARESANQHAAALALKGLELVAYHQGDYAAARTLTEQSLALFQEIGSKRGVASALNSLGLATQMQGDDAAARTLYEQGLALHREMGDKRGIANALTNLGLLAHEQGDYVTARDLHEQGLTLFREMGNKYGTAVALSNLGNLALEQGDTGGAQMRYCESVMLCQEMDDKDGLFYTLSGLAAVAALLGDLPRAVRLAATAESLRLSIGGAWESTEGRIYERTVAAAREGLGEARFQAAWVEGEQMTVDEAVAYAFQSR